MLTLALTVGGGAAISMLAETVFSNIFQVVLARLIGFVCTDRSKPMYVTLKSKFFHVKHSLI